VVRLLWDRFYVGNDEWRQRVTELLIGCQAVVMFLGRMNGNDGLAWEVDQVFRTAAAEKIVLVVLPLDREEVLTRWERYRERTRGLLPAYQGGEGSSREPNRSPRPNCNGWSTNLKTGAPRRAGGQQASWGIWARLLR
jgi:hypothetical protein